MKTTLKNHLTEKHAEICDNEFFYQNDHEKSTKVIRLIMKILAMEQEVVFSKIERV